MNNRLIVLVDDNPIQATTRRIILEKTGSTIQIASSGAQALDILSDPVRRSSVDLIITDHLMPGMNGPELVTRLREEGIQVPIIVLSGLPDAELQYEGLSIIFRLKPFHPDSLIELVHELFADGMKRSA